MTVWAPTSQPTESTECRTSPKISQPAHTIDSRATPRPLNLAGGSWLSGVQIGHAGSWRSSRGRSASSSMFASQ